MATFPVYNLTGKKTDILELKGDVFEQALKPEVIHQVYVALRANLREPWADTKNRGEVRGGGKKPWQQKGTGRARHGSIRSPIWKGGGVTFGPLSTRTYKQKINQKMGAVALRMCLTDKALRGLILIVEDMPATGKTKDITNLRKQLPNPTKSALVVVETVSDAQKRSVRNIRKTVLKRAQDVNVLDLVQYDTLIITKKGLEILTKRVA